MKEQTIHEISEATGISRFTLFRAIGRQMFPDAARQSGRIWLIDTDHEQFKTWLANRPKQARVKGKQRKRREQVGC